MNNNISISKTLISKHIEYIIPALGLVIALAWNSAFQNFFHNNKYLNSQGPWLYAIMVTTIIIGIIQLLEKTKNKINIKSESEETNTYNLILPTN